MNFFGVKKFKNKRLPVILAWVFLLFLAVGYWLSHPDFAEAVAVGGSYSGTGHVNCNPLFHADDHSGSVSLNTSPSLILPGNSKSYLSNNPILDAYGKTDNRFYELGANFQNAVYNNLLLSTTNWNGPGFLEPGFTCEWNNYQGEAVANGLSAVIGNGMRGALVARGYGGKLDDVYSTEDLLFVDSAAVGTNPVVWSGTHFTSASGNTEAKSTVTGTAGTSVIHTEPLYAIGVFADPLGSANLEPGVIYASSCGATSNYRYSSGIPGFASSASESRMLTSSDSVPPYKLTLLSSNPASSYLEADVRYISGRTVRYYDVPQKAVDLGICTLIDPAVGMDLRREYNCNLGVNPSVANIQTLNDRINYYRNLPLVPDGTLNAEIVNFNVVEAPLPIYPWPATKEDALAEEDVMFNWASQVPATLVEVNCPSSSITQGGGSCTLPPLITSFTVNGSSVFPVSIPEGGSATIRWSSQNASSCAGEGFNTGGSTSNTTGVIVSNISSNQSFKLTCQSSNVLCAVDTDNASSEVVPVAPSRPVITPGACINDPSALGRVTVSWNVVSTAVSYKLYIDRNLFDSLGNSLARVEVINSGTSYPHTSLPSGSLHTYEVKAVNGAGKESALSLSATATSPVWCDVSVSCTGAPASILVGGGATWTTLGATGISGDYNYSWRDSDSHTQVAGISKNFPATYNSSGAKSAWVTAIHIASGKSSGEKACGNAVTVTVPAFEYSLSNSGNISVTQGQSGTNTITATLVNGVAQSVALSVSSVLPAGVSASFAPNSVTPTAGSTLTLTTTASTPVGTYGITVRGDKNSTNNTTNFTLTVMPAVPATVPFVVGQCGLDVNDGKGSFRWTRAATGLGIDFYEITKDAEAPVTMNFSSCGATCSFDDRGVVNSNHSYKVRAHGVTGYSAMTVSVNGTLSDLCGDINATLKINLDPNPVVSVAYGENPTLTWTTTNSPTECHSTAGSGTWWGPANKTKSATAGPTSESPGAITSSKTYFISCSKLLSSNGSVQRSVTANVKPPAPDITTSVSPGCDSSGNTKIKVEWNLPDDTSDSVRSEVLAWNTFPNAPYTLTIDGGTTVKSIDPGVVCNASGYCYYEHTVPADGSVIPIPLPHRYDVYAESAIGQSPVATAFRSAGSCPALSATCAVSPNPIKNHESTVWQVTNVTGGTGVYSFDWSGNNAFGTAVHLFGNPLPPRQYDLSNPSVAETKADATVSISSPNSHLPAKVIFCPTLTINPQPSVQANLSVVPSCVAYNNPATISWNSGTPEPTASSCTSPNFSTGNAVSGSVGTGNLTSPRTYNLSCANSGVTTNATPVTVDVGPATPVLSYTAGASGSGLVTLSWTSVANATNYTLYRFNPDTTPSAVFTSGFTCGPVGGSCTFADNIGVSATYDYKVDAEKGGCATIASNRITVISPPNPVITGTCSLSPTSIPFTSSATWQLSGVSGGNGTYSFAWEERKNAEAYAPTGEVTSYSGGLWIVPKPYLLGGPYTIDRKVTISSLGSVNVVKTCPQLSVYGGQTSCNVTSDKSTLNYNDPADRPTLTWGPINPFPANTTSCNVSAIPADASWASPPAVGVSGNWMVSPINNTVTKSLFRTYTISCPATAGSLPNPCTNFVVIGSKPPQPSLTVTSPSVACINNPTGDITVTWNKITTPSGIADSYELTIDGATTISTATTPLNPDLSCTSTACTFTHRNLGANTNHSYQLIARNGNGVSPAFTDWGDIPIQCAPLPVATCSITPTTPVAYGAKSSIIWSSVGASSCSSSDFATGGLATKGAPGILTNNGFTAISNTINMNCLKDPALASADASCSATVNVKPASPTLNTPTVGACGTQTVNLSWQKGGVGGVDLADYYQIVLDNVVLPAGIFATNSPVILLDAGDINHKFEVLAHNTHGDSVKSNAQFLNGPTPCPTSVNLKFENSEGPVSVSSGASGNLTWTSQNVSGCFITSTLALAGFPKNGLTPADSVGSGALTGPATYRFRITCDTLALANPPATVTDFVDVVVAAPPVIVGEIGCTLNANSPVVLYGTSPTLTWTTSGNPDSCIASGGSGTWTNPLNVKNAGGGSESPGSIFANTTYNLTCSKAGAPNSPYTCGATVAVKPAVSLFVDPVLAVADADSVVSYRGFPTLTWLSGGTTGANPCAISSSPFNVHWDGNTVPNGTWNWQIDYPADGLITKTNSFSIRCSNGPVNSNTITKIVGVKPPAPVITATGPSVCGASGTINVSWTKTPVAVTEFYEFKENGVVRTALADCSGATCVYSRVAEANEAHNFTVTANNKYGASPEASAYFIMPDTCPFNVSCSATPSSITSGNSAVWTATASGGTGTYSYSWGGVVGSEHNLSNTTAGTLSTPSITYTLSGSTAETKTATINVTSGGVTQPASCILTVTPASASCDINPTSRYVYYDDFANLPQITWTGTNVSSCWSSAYCGSGSIAGVDTPSGSATLPAQNKNTVCWTGGQYGYYRISCNAKPGYSPATPYCGTYTYIRPQAPNVSISSLRKCGDTTTNSIVVSWDPTALTSSYRIYKDFSATPLVVNGSSIITGTSVTLPNSGGSHTYDVRAVNSYGESLPSFEATRTSVRTFDGTSSLCNLNVSCVPEEGGAVTSNDGFINCGAGNLNCSRGYNWNSSVTLTKSPASGFIHGAWGGVCVGISGNSCSVIMDDDKSASCVWTSNPNPIGDIKVKWTPAGEPANISIDGGANSSANPTTVFGILAGIHSVSVPSIAGRAITVSVKECTTTSEVSCGSVSSVVPTNIGGRQTVFVNVNADKASVIEFVYLSAVGSVIIHQEFVGGSPFVQSRLDSNPSIIANPNQYGNVLVGDNHKAYSSDAGAYNITAKKCVNDAVANCLVADRASATVSAEGVDKYVSLSANNDVQAGRFTHVTFTYTKKTLAVTCSAAPDPAGIAENVNWTSTASGGVAPYAYSWSGTAITDAGNSPATNNSSFTSWYASGGTKQASLSVTSSDGISGLASCQVAVGETCSTSCNLSSLAGGALAADQPAKWSSLSSCSAGSSYSYSWTKGGLPLGSTPTESVTVDNAGYPAGVYVEGTVNLSCIRNGVAVCSKNASCGATPSGAQSISCSITPNVIEYNKPTNVSLSITNPNNIWGVKYFTFTLPGGEFPGWSFDYGGVNYTGFGSPINLPGVPFTPPPTPQIAVDYVIGGGFLNPYGCSNCEYGINVKAHDQDNFVIGEGNCKFAFTPQAPALSLTVAEESVGLWGDCSSGGESINVDPGEGVTFCYSKTNILANTCSFWSEDNNVDPATNRIMPKTAIGDWRRPASEFPTREVLTSAVPGTYTLRCQGADLSFITDSVTVNVNSTLEVQHTVDLRVNGKEPIDEPVTINYGDIIQIGWATLQMSVDNMCESSMTEGGDATWTAFPTRKSIPPGPWNDPPLISPITSTNTNPDASTEYATYKITCTKAGFPDASDTVRVKVNNISSGYNIQSGTKIYMNYIRGGGQITSTKANITVGNIFNFNTNVSMSNVTISPKSATLPAGVTATSITSSPNTAGTMVVTDALGPSNYSVKPNFADHTNSASVTSTITPAMFGDDKGLDFSVTSDKPLPVGEYDITFSGRDAMNALPAKPVQILLIVREITPQYEEF